jgi:hypothetical protein
MSFRATLTIVMSISAMTAPHIATSVMPSFEPETAPFTAGAPA